MAVERDTYRHAVLRHLAVTEGIRELTHLSLLDPRVARPDAGLVAPSTIFARFVVVGHNATRMRCPDAELSELRTRLCRSIHPPLPAPPSRAAHENLSRETMRP